MFRTAYRNRTDDLRITRRTRGVHRRPPGHMRPGRTCSRSERVQADPESLLADALAMPAHDQSAPAAPRRVGPRGPHALRVRGRVACFRSPRDLMWLGKSDPLLAKSAQGVSDRPWPRATASVGLLRSAGIRVHWCQPWVSAAWRPARISRAANHLIRRDPRPHTLPAHFATDLLKCCSLMRNRRPALSVAVRPRNGQGSQVTMSARWPERAGCYQPPSSNPPPSSYPPSLSPWPPSPWPPSSWRSSSWRSS